MYIWGLLFEFIWFTVLAHNRTGIRPPLQWVLLRVWNKPVPRDHKCTNYFGAQHLRGNQTMFQDNADTDNLCQWKPVEPIITYATTTIKSCFMHGHKSPQKSLTFGEKNTGRKSMEKHGWTVDEQMVSGRWCRCFSSTCFRRTFGLEHQAIGEWFMVKALHCKSLSLVGLGLAHIFLKQKIMNLNPQGFVLLCWNFEHFKAACVAAWNWQAN